MCEQTLTGLGLKFEVDKMFHSIGLLEFMHMEAPTYKHATLEFFSTLDFHFHRKWVGDVRYFYGTLKFNLFNQNHKFSVEDLRSIL